MPPQISGFETRTRTNVERRGAVQWRRSPSWRCPVHSAAGQAEPSVRAPSSINLLTERGVEFRHVATFLFSAG